MSNPTRRPYKTHSQWREIISDFQQSGLDATHYCQQHELGDKTFQKWKRYFTRPQTPEPQQSDFIELTPPQPAVDSAATAWDVELQLSNNMILRLRTP